MRALIRDPNKPAARALAEAGADVVSGDMDRLDELQAAFRGADGVFSVQNFWLPNVGVEGEVRQGKLVADAAKAAGDELTEPQIAETLAKVIGRPVSLQVPSLPEGAALEPERVAMFQFFNTLGYDADIPA